MKFYIKTYGCQMNERDSDSAAALLIEAGHQPVECEEEADVVILNTCSVRDQAERKAIGKLGFLGKLLRERPHMVFGIMGCMAQSRGDELLKKIKHLDFAVGTDRIHEIPRIAEAAVRTRRKQGSFERASADSPGVDAHRFSGAESPFSAFVSIMRGCSRYCSYCIVPYVRGPERSRSPESILAECRMLAARGVKEIFLLGQNVSAFGMDNMPPPPEDAPSPFADLLSAIARIDGIERIRFTSPHPAYFNDALIEAVAREKKICKSLHLPLQSGSDAVLKRMNRPYTSDCYRSIVNRLKERAPGVVFTTDVIVGFPGETEEDFRKTQDLMNEVGFDNAFIFKYSPRKGTRSAQMEDDVPKDEKERRNQILLADLSRRVEESNRMLLGREFELLVEGPSKRNPNRWSGRTDTYKLAVFEPTRAVELGDSVRVRIVRTTPMTLYGEMI